MTTIEAIRAYSAGLFSELNADVKVERDRNNGKFWVKASSKPFAFHVEQQILETSTNFEMKLVVDGLRDRFVATVSSGNAPRRISDVAVEPLPEPEPEAAAAVEPEPVTADTDPAPAPVEAQESAR